MDHSPVLPVQESAKEAAKPAPLPSRIITQPVIMGDLTLASARTQTTVGAAGGASALPAKPTGYLMLNLGNTSYVIAFYAIS